MDRDIQVHTQDRDRLKAELQHLVDRFRGLGYERCDVFFGWAWRTGRDESDIAWKRVNVELSDVAAEIERAEADGLGEFGGDDVRITFEGRALEFQFCHAVHRGTDAKPSFPRTRPREPGMIERSG